MFKKKHTATEKLTISALVIALYVAIMFFTQSFAFGQYQVRIATSLYALCAIHPFLIIHMGIANLISNTVMGGLGILDMLGGCCVGIVSGTLISLVKKHNLPNFCITLIIILVPGLGVASWLSYLLHIPYMVLAVSLLIGQVIPGVVGAVLVTALERRAAGIVTWKENTHNAQ